MSHSDDEEPVEYETPTVSLADIDRLLSSIPRDFFQEHGFNPFLHWKEASEVLEDRKRQLEQAVEAIVQSCFKGFNTSTSGFANILQSFTDSQELFNRLQSNLQNSKRLLAGNPQQQNLRLLWFESMMYKKVLEIIDKIDYVLSVPQRIDLFLKRKQYLHAVHMLNRTLALLVSEDLRQMEGLQEIQDELLTRRNALQEILIERLHQIIYAPGVPNTDTNTTDDGKQGRSSFRSGSGRRSGHSVSNIFDAFQDDGETGSDRRDSFKSMRSLRSESDRSSERRSNRRGPTSDMLQYDQDSFPSFLFINPDGTEAKEFGPMFEEETKIDYLRNPEGNPETFLRVVVESIDRLDRLPSAESALHRCLRGELKKIIETQTQQFKQYVEKHHAAQFKQMIDPARKVSPTVIDPATSAELLLELEERIFSVFTKVLRNHINCIQLFKHYLTARASGCSSSHLEPQSYTTEAVWEAMQQELQEHLVEYLQGAKKKNAIATRIYSLDAEEKKNELTFSFDDSNVPSVGLTNRGKPAIVELKDEVKEHQEMSMKVSQIWIQPNPYNITSVYRRVIQFTDQAHSMIGVSPQQLQQKQGLNALRMFMNDFVQNLLMPRVQADAHVQVKDILSSTSAFTLRENNRGAAPQNNSSSTFINASAILDETDANLPLLRCALEVAEMVRKIFADMYQMPFVNEFASVVEYVMGRFLEKCQEKYIELTRGSLSGQRLQDSNVVKILRSDPLYCAMRGLMPQVDSKDLEGYFYEQERHIYSSLFSGDLVAERHQLILDGHRWSSLALLAESLEWLIDKVRLLADPSSSSSSSSGSFKEHRRTDSKPPSLASRRSIRANPSNLMKHSKSVSVKVPTGAESAVSKRLATIFGPDRDFLADSLQQLADMCLFTLRVEFSIHCFFFINSMLSESYWLTEEPTTPEPFVLDLNTNLSLAEEKLSPILPPIKIRYLFGSLAPLISCIAINNLPRLHHLRVNPNGVAQMTRNLFALQQNLTNIVMTQEHHFDRARQYWDLLNLSEEDLAEFANQQQKQNLFSIEEYRALFAIQTPFRKAQLVVS